ncbi:MAG: O-antigen ligase domain-containing protein [Microcystaceae cyanobacterium]
MLEYFNRKNHPIEPQNFEEKLIWYSTILTYVFYFTGTLYFVGPLVGWVLVFRLLYRKYQGENLPIPLTSWLWIFCTLLLLVALWGGLMDFNFDLVSVIKATFGWAKGWALFAVLPLAGVLPIRPAIVYRAICIVGLQCLIFFPFYYIAALINLPSPLYTVPLNFFGAPPDCFNVGLYVIDFDTNTPRINLFAPWASASGFIGNGLFPLTLQEKNGFWKICGMSAMILMVYVCSASRSAVVMLPLALGLTWLLSQIAKPSMMVMVGFSSALLGTVGMPLKDAVEDYIAKAKGARPGSTRVRNALDNIALERFPEALLFGHATTERGPKVVEHMPIGSHNTYTALLFLRGIVGYTAFILGLAGSFFNLWWNSLKMPVAFCGLEILFIIIFNSRYDSSEVTIYLIWQSLVVMGIAYCGEKRNASELKKQTV